ncbi:MAG: hypothetical protein AAF387_12485, partial [Pseudomonadota bacterium]
ALLLAITAAPASASTKLEIGGQVTFADGAPASGVDVDLFEALLSYGTNRIAISYSSGMWFIAGWFSPNVIFAS